MNVSDLSFVHIGFYYYLKIFTLIQLLGSELPFLGSIPPEAECTCIDLPDWLKYC